MINYNYVYHQKTGGFTNPEELCTTQVGLGEDLKLPHAVAHPTC